MGVLARAVIPDRGNIYRGDSWSLAYTITTNAQAPYDLSMYPTSRCQIRPTEDSPYAATGTVTRSGAELNQFTIFFADDVTARMAPGKWVGDVEVTDGDIVVTVLKFTVTVEGDVTR